MTKSTETAIRNVVEKLNEIRETLDTAMFSDQNLPEEDYSKLRKIYDSICKTIDLI